MRSVKLHKVHETTTVLYLVMELLTGGELFDRIVERGSLTEADAARSMRELCDALQCARNSSSASPPPPKEMPTIPHH